MNSKILTILTLICLPFFVVAQTRSTETVKIDGQAYYMHTIKADETIQEVAKLYNVAVIDIEENNPTILLLGKLKAGTRLRIPDYTEISKDYPLSKWDFTYYQVKSQVKLKDIAKEYNIDVKDIKKNNPNINNKPALLSKIRIPLKKDSKEALALAAAKAKDKENLATNPAAAFNWDKKEEHKQPEKDDDKAIKKEEPENKPCEKQDYDPRKQSFNISFLLPLQIQNSKSDYDTYVSFLEGALLAVEQLKNEGFSAKININDVYSNASLSKALTNTKTKEADLIIGPFSANALKAVSEFSKTNNIPLVSPYEPKAEALAKDNPYFIQVYPSEASINRELFQKTIANNAPTNVVLIYPTNPDTTLVKFYEDELKKTFHTYTKYEHRMGLRNDAITAAALKRDVQNLLFVASNDEPFVSDLLDRLIIVKNTLYPISLYGTTQWRNKFKMIDLTRYYMLNMHYVQPFYINYSNDNVKAFVSNYRQTYNNDPTQYAFLGYDVTYYFLTALKNYGRSFAHCLNKLEVPLLQMRYKFEQVHGNDGGYVNTEPYLLEYTPDITVIQH